MQHIICYYLCLAQMEINSADRIMKWLTMLFRHSVIDLNPEKSNEILDNIKNTRVA